MTALDLGRIAYDAWRAAMSTATVACTRCGGHGKYAAWCDRCILDDHEPHPRVCSDCNGTGRAPYPTPPEWDALDECCREAKGLHSVRDDRGRLRAHVLPVLGERPITAVTAADLRGLVAALDDKVAAGELAWKTAGNVWGVVSKMFADAAHSKRETLRVREDNPAAGVEGPDHGARKARSYLYPAELTALLACPEVLPHWRRIFALAVYTYARAGELEALTWADVDLAHGVLHIHSAADRETAEVRETKTKHARRAPIELELLPLLRVMHREAGGLGRVIPHMPSRELGASTLRAGLRAAGIARAELFAESTTRRALTFHDLRATGITWCAVRGDEPLRIQRRAGHTDLATTQGYIREAEHAGERFGSVFPPLPPAVFDAPAIVHESSRGSRDGAIREENPRHSAASPTGFEPDTGASTDREARRTLRNSSTRRAIRGPLRRNRPDHGRFLDDWSCRD